MLFSRIRCMARIGLLWEWLHYATIRDLTTVANCTVGIQNPDTVAVALGNSPPLIWAGANVARVEPEGLRVHPARTNLCLRNEQMGLAFQPPWGVLRATITDDDVAAPDGVVDADKLVEDNTPASTHLCYQGIVVANFTQYCWSVFARADERSVVELTTTLPSGAYAGVYDLTAGTASLTSGDVAGIENWGGGWYRCYLVFTTGIADAGNRTFYWRLRVGGVAVYNGDGVSGLHLWGSQIETGASPSPLIETGAASATSVAPVYYQTRDNIIYHDSRVAIQPEIDLSVPFVPADVARETHEGYPVFTLWQDANNYLTLFWQPAALGDRWGIRDVIGGAPANLYIASAWAPVVDNLYDIRLRDWHVVQGVGTYFTIQVYDRVAQTTIEEVYVLRTRTEITCNRLYLGCWGDETGQWDFHIKEVRG